MQQSHVRRERSSGGFGGPDLTPQSTHMNMHLIISDHTYEAYSNDSLILKTEYTLEDRVLFDSTFHFIVLEHGDDYAYSFGKDKLVLDELCSDCYQHHYKKE